MKNPNKTKAPVVGATQGSQEKSLPQKQPCHLTAKSTTRAAQHEQILRMFDAHRQRTTEDFRAAGIYQVSTRILELRRKGYDIQTELVDLWDRAGVKHRRCARYTLVMGGQR